MESHHCNIFRSYVLVLLLIVFLGSKFSLSFSGSLLSLNEEKVRLTLYYEALCPGCEDFVVNDMYKIFENGLISIVDLKLSPYGNANIGPNGTIICQHGEWECKLNTVEACAIYAWPTVSDHFPFIHCVESLNFEDKYTEWETCFKKLNLDPKPVTDCYTSGIGHKLELQYADEIKALEPPHMYVPWVVVDGQPLYEEYEDFMSFICKAYKGSNVPQACHGLTDPIIAHKDNAKPFNHLVCFNEEDKVKLSHLEIVSKAIASWMDHVSW
ncbi:gamma-interferon-responsive lysosomal thiol protein-like [Rutidosis leptorrhynchoides]|uniref:gamma-interferon-responsive lysosomal thiol protein-like n=1 Tax=Rutidosis leptorrhynchoides TaxID=125765 RepID=UPI003A9999B1